MERIERIKRARDMNDRLGCLERSLGECLRVAPESRPRHDLMAIRAQMTALEHQIALLRLVQSENRLRQQRWIAIPSLLGGAVLALVRHNLKSA